MRINDVIAALCELCDKLEAAQEVDLSDVEKYFDVWFEEDDNSLSYQQSSDLRDAISEVCDRIEKLRVFSTSVLPDEYKEELR